jgi:ribonuclease HII
VLHVGTDEAGYGPLLGPLVVSAAAYETDAPRASLPSQGIADSKIVYSRGGRDALARVLGPYLGLTHPVRLSELLSKLSVRGDVRDGYAWYGEVSDPVPEAGEAPDSFRGLHVNPVCARDFNAGCREWGGKGGVLFRETMRVVRRALEHAPDHEAEVICDKHGGRNRYAALLLAELGPSTLVPEREAADCSSYRLMIGGRKVRISFLRSADSQDTPAALASMAAKYVRELFMEAMNSYFARRSRGLRPTAGYHGDGQRFLREIAPILDEIDCDRDSFLRSR